MKRVIMDVFPTPGSPRKTSLYLYVMGDKRRSYFSRGAIRGAPPSGEVVVSAALLMILDNWVFNVFPFPQEHHRPSAKPPREPREVPFSFCFLQTNRRETVQNLPTTLKFQL